MKQTLLRICILPLALASVAFGEFTIDPSDDVYVNGSATTTNYNSLGYGIVQWDDRDMYFRYDVSGLHGTVVSAYFKITIQWSDAGDYGSTHDIELAKDDWDESTVTWATRPESTIADIGSWSTASGTHANSLDVTSEVQDAIDGDGKISFRLYTAVNSYTEYDTKEGSSGPNRPKLYIKMADVYRSVGPSNTSEVATGGSNAMTIAYATGRATFTNDLPDSVGVGDIIEYDNTGDATRDVLAVIHKRISQKIWQVMATDNDSAVGTSGGSSTESWKIYRAYTSLANAVDVTVGGTENTGIAAGLRDFDTGPKNLTTATQIFQVACYGDNGTADNTAVDVDSWTTDASYYIRIFTPNNTSTEVKTSQRHAGVWDDAKYRLEITDAHGLDVSGNTEPDYMKVQGLQIHTKGTSGSKRGVNFDKSDDGTLSHCILKNSNTGGSMVGYYGAYAGPYYIYNNIIYDFDFGMNLDAPNNGTDCKVYNNTVYGCGTGISTAMDDAANNTWQAGHVSNNLCAGNTTDDFEVNYTGWTNSHDAKNNASGDGTGGNFANSSGFLDIDDVSVATTFVDADNDDFRIRGTATWIIDAGADLSSENLYTDDVQGETRSSWDIGADEYVNTNPTVDALDTYTSGAYTADNTPDLQFDLDDADGHDVKYQIQVDQSSDFSTASSYADVTETSGSTPARSNVIYTPSSLSDGSYYWRVKAIDEIYGTSSWNTANSGSVAFIVDATAPTNVGLSSPTNAATDVATDATLYIKTATDAGIGLHSSAPYYIELATDDAFTQNVQNSGWQSPTSWSPTLSGGTTYYWHVKARDDLSTESSYYNHTTTGYGTFTTETAGLTSLSVTHTNLIASRLCTVTIAFTTANTVPVDGDVQVTFGAGFGLENAEYVSGNSGAAVSYSGQVLTINLGTALGASEAVSIVVSGIRNYNASGSGGTYAIETQDDGDTQIDDGTAAANTFTPKHIYRSAGKDKTTVVTTRTGTLTIANGIATFSVAVNNIMGVGDAIEYDADDAGGVSDICFVHRRFSDKVFEVAAEGGGEPTATSGAINTWDVWRAYTSLSNAEAGTVNGSITVSYDSWTDGQDLRNGTGTDEVWNIACYADATDGGVDITDWDTDSDNYIRVFVPRDTTEVGTSQRHEGKWDETKYWGESTAGGNYQAHFTIRESYTRVEGIQFKRHTGGYGWICGFRTTNSAVGIVVDGCFALGVAGTGNFSYGGYYIFDTGDGAEVEIRNSIFTGFTGSNSQAIYFRDGNTLDIYNTVVTGSNRGIHRDGSGTGTVTNCALFNNSNDVDGAFTIDYTASDDGDGGVNGIDWDNESTDWDAAFMDYSNNDFRIKSNSVLRDVGDDLESSASFSNDIHGDTRESGDWDIGADELIMGSLTSASVTHTNLVAGRLCTATIAFTTVGAIPVDGDVQVTFGSGFNIANATYVSGNVSSACSYSGQVLTVNLGTAVGASEAVSIVVSGIRNYSSSGSGGTYAIETQGSDDYPIDSTNAAANTFTPKHIYRSVEYNRSTVVTTRTGNLTIANGMATFGSDVCDSMGVGDAIEYDADDAGGVSDICFVHSRLSATQFEVASESGAVPTATSGAINTWDVWRAYTSLANAEGGTVNGDITVSYDSWSSGYDISTATGIDAVWNIACYGGPSAEARTSSLSINGWTSEADNYLRIFSPFRPSEVERSQRHNGKWDDTKYRIEGSHTSDYYLRVLFIEDDFVRIDGLQVKLTNNDYTPGYGYDENSVGTGEFYITNNIFWCVYSTTDDDAVIGIKPDDQESTHYVYNNIVYGWGNSSNSYGIMIYGTNYVYNNTVSGGGYGIRFVNGTHVGKNNAVFNNSNDFYTLPAGTFEYNASDDGDGTNPVDISPNSNEAVDWNRAVNDYAANDYGVKGIESVLYNAGEDLSGTFSTDCRDTARPSSNWDIGAMEFVPSFQQIYRSVGPSNTSDLNTTSRTVTIANDTATFNAYVPKNIGLGDVLEYPSASPTALAFIHYRVDEETFVVKSSTGGTAVSCAAGTNVKIYRAYTSLFNAEAGTENSAFHDDVQYFESWSGSKDLVAADQEWNIVCYADAVDETAVSVAPWTKDTVNCINIFTPVGPTEVGESQRHAGVWDDNKYRLEVTDAQALGVNQGPIRVEGLQVLLKGTASDIGVIDTRIRGRVGHCIIKSTSTGTGHNGIYSQKGSEIYNNIIYDFSTSGSYGMYFNWNYEDTYGTTTFFNNTVYNCANGVASGGNGGGADDVMVINNIVSTCGTNWPTTDWDNSSDNNASDDATIPSDGSNEYASQSFTFQDSANDDFRLSASDAGARDLGTSLAANDQFDFTDDVAGNTRSGSWDIGASEAQAVVTDIYRSMGKDKTSDLNTVSATVEIVDDTATFSQDLPTDIGLGDVLQYPTGSPANLAFIHYRAAANKFAVKSAAGGTPTAAGAGTQVEIFRAYISLENAEKGTENTAFDNSLEDFDTWTNGKDISRATGSNQRWHIACYADATEDTKVAVNGWTTSAENYVRIFTPRDADEVGVQQRHNGKWDDNKFKIEVTATAGYTRAVVANDDHVRFEGLQVNLINDGNNDCEGIHVEEDNNACTFYISHNIVKGTITGTPAQGCHGIRMHYYSDVGSEIDTCYVYNNIVYDFNTAANDKGITQPGNSYTLLYNNTVYNCATGYHRQYGTIIAKNNIANGCTNGWDGSFNSASDYNISDVDASDAPNATFTDDYKTVTFYDATGSPRDLRLGADANAKDKGTDLSSDSYLAFSDDIQGYSRPSSSSWDIGADEWWSDPNLAVTMDMFEARAGDKADTLLWRTQSEDNNAGYNLYRRIKPEWYLAKQQAINSGPQVIQASNAKVAEDAMEDAKGETPLAPWRLGARSSFADKFGNDTTWTIVNMLGLIPGAPGGRSVGTRNYRFIDIRVENDITYEYLLKDYDYDGTIGEHGPVEATPSRRIPKVFALHQNYPNPFNPITRINYDLPIDCRVTLAIYNMQGRRIVTLVQPDKKQEAGYYHVMWKGVDHRNRPVASGVYFYRMNTPKYVKVRKMMMLK